MPVKSRVKLPSTKHRLGKFERLLLALEKRNQTHMIFFMASGKRP